MNDQTTIIPTPQMASDPTGRFFYERGCKLDAGKPPLWRGAIRYFPRALVAVAQLSLVGAKKYSWDSWRYVPDAINRYNDALVRHLVEDPAALDEDTQVPHCVAVAWNALAIVELVLQDENATRSALAKCSSD